MRLMQKSIVLIDSLVTRFMVPNNFHGYDYNKTDFVAKIAFFIEIIEALLGAKYIQAELKRQCYS